MGRKSTERQKPTHRKGLWSPEEDQRLSSYIFKHGHGCWSTVPIGAGLQRNGKSCRLRWMNYLRPGLKRGMFSAEEEETILTLHSMLGNKWSQIAQHLPGRTDNEVKNHWHSHLKKRLPNKAAKATETSSSEITDSSAPAKKIPETHVKSYISFQNLEESSPLENSITEQSVHFGFSNTTSMPKLLFSEWLSSSDPVTFSASFLYPKDGISNASNLQDTFSQSCLSNYEGEAGCQFQNDFTFSSEFQFEDQIPGTGLGDSVSKDDSCNDFIMNNDLMYI